MVKLKKINGQKIVPLIGTALIICILISFFFPFITSIYDAFAVDPIFPYKSFHMDVSLPVSGYNSIIGMFFDDISSVDTPNIKFSVLLHTNDETDISMLLFAISCLVSLIASLTLLTFNLLAIFTETHLKRITRTAGVALILSTITTLIMGIFVANKFGFYYYNPDPNYVYEVRTSIGLWLFTGFGILAGAASFLQLKCVADN